MISIWAFAVKTVFFDEDEEATPGVEAEPGVLLLPAAAEAGDPVEEPLVDESGPGGRGEGMITRRGCSGRPVLTANTLGGGEKAASTLDTYELGLPKSASEAIGTLTVHLGDTVEDAPNKELKRSSRTSILTVGDVLSSSGGWLLEAAMEAVEAVEAEESITAGLSCTLAQTSEFTIIKHTHKF